MWSLTGPALYPMGLDTEDTMNPDIYDKHGNRRDLTWLRQKYGAVQLLDAGAGLKFKLVRIDESEGPAVLKVRVLDEQGSPRADQPVANHWPDPGLSDLRNGGLKTLWRERAVHQRTDGAGFTGFGLGAGSYIANLQEGGPHVVWVLSPSLPSDGVSGLGMLGGTNHEGPLFLTFQIGQDGNVTPPPPAPEPRDDLDRLLALAAPMAAGNRAPQVIAVRAAEILGRLKEQRAEGRDQRSRPSDTPTL